MSRKLKAIRVLVGKTQYDIAKESGICQSRISLIENGYIAVNKRGYFSATKNPIHRNIKMILKKIEGNRCNYFFENEIRKKYCAHRYNSGNF